MQNKILQISSLYDRVFRGDNMNKKLRGSIVLTLATILWGSTFVFQDMAEASGLGAFTFQASRCFLAVLVLLPVIWLFDRSKTDGKTYFSRWCDPKLWKGGLLCGIPLFLACNLQQLGIGDAGAGKSAFLTAMYIVIVPIIGIFLKKKPSIMIPVSLALAVAGLYFLSFKDVPQVSLGDLLLIACALAFAVQITFVDIYAPQVDPLRLNVVQAGVCTLLSAAMALFTEDATLSLIGANWLNIGYAGVLSMGAAYCMQIFGQRDLEPTTASLVMSLEAVFAVLCGVIFLHETMDGNRIFGCILMFIAVILSQIPVSLKKKTK